MNTDLCEWKRHRLHISPQLLHPERVPDAMEIGDMGRIEQGRQWNFLLCVWISLSVWQEHWWSLNSFWKDLWKAVWALFSYFTLKPSLGCLTDKPALRIWTALKKIGATVPRTDTTSNLKRTCTALKAQADDSEHKHFLEILVTLNITLAVLGNIRISLVNSALREMSCSLSLKQYFTSTVCPGENTGVIKLPRQSCKEGWKGPTPKQDRTAARSNSTRGKTKRRDWESSEEHQKHSFSLCESMHRSDKPSVWMLLASLHPACIYTLCTDKLLLRNDSLHPCACSCPAGRQEGLWQVGTAGPAPSCWTLQVLPSVRSVVPAGRAALAANTCRIPFNCCPRSSCLTASVRADLLIMALIRALLTLHQCRNARLPQPSCTEGKRQRSHTYTQVCAAPSSRVYCLSFLFQEPHSERVAVWAVTACHITMTIAAFRRQLRLFNHRFPPSCPSQGGRQATASTGSAVGGWWGGGGGCSTHLQGGRTHVPMGEWGMGAAESLSIWWDPSLQHHESNRDFRDCWTHYLGGEKRCQEPGAWHRSAGSPFLRSQVHGPTPSLPPSQCPAIMPWPQPQAYSRESDSWNQPHSLL